MDRTLEAEMEAARAAARRSRTLRELLLTLEDSGGSVSITSVDGSHHGGTVTAVGSDHVAIAIAGRERVIALEHLVSVETER